MADVLQMPLLFGVEEPSAPSGAAPTDEAERQKALDVTRSWVVEAPAGSGKTGLLVQRFLKLLAYGGVDRPDEVMAITFTRKANAEMRRRVLEQLAAAATGEPLQPDAPAFQVVSRGFATAALRRDRDQGWDLLTSPQQLNIRTIDSLCGTVAASLPLLAGAGGRYTPTEDAEPMYLAAAEQTLLLMGGTDPVLTRDLEQLLLLRDASAADFTALLASMLRQREQWGELLPLGPEALTDDALDLEVRPRLERTLHRLVGDEIAAVASLVDPDLLAELAHLAHACRRCEPYKVDRSPLLCCGGGPHPPGCTAEDLPHWLCLTNLLLKKEGWRARVNRADVQFLIGADQQTHLLDLIQRFQKSTSDPDALQCALQTLRALPDPVYPDELWALVKPLCRVLKQALLELQLVFAKYRSCDFAEVSLNARALLRAGTEGQEAATAIAQHLRRLLVDEMQDTSAGQYELLQRLTEDWDGTSQTVFLVGDPKQSIYEFRQARVERFRRMMQRGRLGRLRLTPLTLTANFRSQAGLVDAFNATFASVFPTANDLANLQSSADVPFVAATAVRSAGEGPAIVWHPVLETGQDEEGDEEPAEGAPNPVLQQARQLRDTLATFLEEWPSRGMGRRPQVAVLGRTRNHLAAVIRELQGGPGKPAIPFRAVDVEALAQRPEVVDLLSLTRALLDPSDRIAWLAVLRSPLCGLSLSDLLLLTGEGSDAPREATVLHLLQTRAQHLSEDGQAALARATSVLLHVQADRGRAPLSVDVERAWRSLGADAVLAPEARQNAERYLQLLRGLEAGEPPVTLPALQRRLERLYAESFSGEADVELMTIHKAKGLEWDLVLIPRLEAGAASNREEFLRWLEFDGQDFGGQDQEAGESAFLLAPIAAKGESASRLSLWMGRHQATRQQAEAKRVFYVGTTRAREELHLFATVAESAPGILKAPGEGNSLLRAAWPAAEAALIAALTPQAKPASVLNFPAPASVWEPLSLAAAAEPAPEPTATQRQSLTSRVPLRFDALSRFSPVQGAGLPHAAAPPPGVRAPFDRPEGSFEARAFGNVVHRFLPLLCSRLAAGACAPAVSNEVLTWLPRLRSALRAEGLSITKATADAARVQQALSATLADPSGLWLISAHRSAADEVALSGPGGTASAGGLRADRTFLAGPAPLAPGEDYLWIVDYKTGELGGRSQRAFLTEQRRNYGGQMQAYAKAAVEAGYAPGRLILALYFPLLPALDCWPYAHGEALDYNTSVGGVTTFVLGTGGL